MDLKSKINTLDIQVKNGESVTLSYLTELEEELEHSRIRNKTELSSKLFLIKQQLYPSKKPTMWELFLRELSLKKNIESVLEFFLYLNDIKKKQLSLQEINELELKWEEILEVVNDPELLTERERAKVINEFKKKIRVFRNRLTTEVDSSLGEFLRQARMKKGYSLQNVEDLTGLSSSHISRLESNSRKPSIRTIEKLARILDISNEELFEKMNIDIRTFQSKPLELFEIIDNPELLINGELLTKKDKKMLKTQIRAFLKTRK